MSSPFYNFARVVLMSAALAIPSVAFAQMQQSDDVDPEVRVQQLEGQLRQLTGQNEELQFRNRQLEDQIRQLQAGAPPAGRPNVAAVPAQPAPVARQPVQPQVQPQVYDQQQAAAPAPIVQDPAPPPRGGRRNDAFDPNANPNAPGVPRALGGGRQPVPANAPVAMPGSRGAGEPLPLGNAAPAPSGGLTTLPPGATSKDEFDLGIGYMQRRDYALAEETMRNFAQKYPTDPQIADSQYWLGESFFQRQKYRDAAEAFLGVTTKFGTSAKAPDALLRLGQSLAALKEKEAACAAFGEVLRKYPRASGGVKTAVDREQKRVKC
ncbi:MAG: tol-pal system protein [Tardiphaga sp.]|uniref:tol-pal system protein YbgF n=1 Tax=Tardiphaga sp. TaxID=1926292 RepID=UPI00260A80D8|nr:tol-pal system protein YbgF [Tardiphaga sp.]MDB5503251.1 tol-pal system protein [Tardiphaga sp.]